MSPSKRHNLQPNRNLDRATTSRPFFKNRNATAYKSSSCRLAIGPSGRRFALVGPCPLPTDDRRMTSNSYEAQTTSTNEQLQSGSWQPAVTGGRDGPAARRVGRWVRQSTSRGRSVALRRVGHGPGNRESASLSTPRGRAAADRTRRSARDQEHGA